VEDSKYSSNTKRKCYKLKFSTVTYNISSTGNIMSKTWFKILGITLEGKPENWDIHLEEILKKASERMYILRVFNDKTLSVFNVTIYLWS